MNELRQIFDTVNIGLVILDKDLTVRYWNRWMESNSGISSERIVGTPLFDLFPTLNTSKFLRSCKSVLNFGNFAFFSQKLHRFLFPFKPVSAFESQFEFMQQSCSLGPLRDESHQVVALFLTIQDVTELAISECRLIEMNIRDSLTGVYNRRFLEKRLSEEFERFVRYGRKFSLIMFDIDFFKHVNDTHGHPCGDFVLKGITDKIGCMIRKTDYVARYGGEEFCCLLPETDLASAAILAERFRIAIAEETFRYKEKAIHVTISLGLSELSHETPTPESLLKKADDALYSAKATGRNRSVARA